MNKQLWLILANSSSLIHANVCLYFVTCIAVITTEVDTVGMVGRPHEGVEHIFGDSFISLPREVFTVNADNAYYGSGKLGARRLQCHINICKCSGTWKREIMYVEA